MFLLGLALTVCYVPGVTGFALPTGWLLLSATLPWVLRGEMLRVFTNPFLLWAGLGLGWTMVWQQGVYDLWKLTLIVAVFVMAQVHTTRMVPHLLCGMALGLCVSTVAAFAQSQGWTGLPTLPLNAVGLPSSAGLFFNPNVLGEISALVAIGVIAYGLWPLAIPALTNVILSESRTAILALGICGSIYLWRRFAQAGPILVLVIALSTTGWLFDKSAATLGYRFAIWSNTIAGLTPLGRGPGSFLTTYPVFATHTDSMASREEDAHNDLLQIAYQYGLPGLAILLPLVALGLAIPLDPERYLLIAFLTIAALDFPLEIPCEAFLGSFALGRLWSHRSLLRRSRLARRWPIRGWLAASQPPHDRGGLHPLPLEPLHPHQGRLFRHSLRLS